VIQVVENLSGNPSTALGEKKKKFTFLIIKELMQIKSSVAETEIQYRVKIKLRKSQEK
jgi:hypothetical protein